MLKNLIMASLGAAHTIKEQVEKDLKKLEEEGKLSKEDFKTFISSLEEKGKIEEENVKEHIKSHLKELVEELGLVTKEDLEKLKEELKENK